MFVDAPRTSFTDSEVNRKVSESTSAVGAAMISVTCYLIGSCVAVQKFGCKLRSKERHLRAVVIYAVVEMNDLQESDAPLAVPRMYPVPHQLYSEFLSLVVQKLDYYVMAVPQCCE